MAERSFKKEVEQLKLGAGQEFRGEAILCVTKALLQSGVSYVSGYQGAPISHLIDVLNDAEPVPKASPGLTPIARSIPGERAAPPRMEGTTIRPKGVIGANANASGVQQIPVLVSRPIGSSS
jgi:hypothetical protein